MKRLLLSLLIALLILTLAACGGGGTTSTPAPTATPTPTPTPTAMSSTPTPTPTPSATSSGKVTIQYLFFDPDSITVNVGDTVTWVNKSSDEHTVTGTGWDSGYLSLGQTYSRKFDTAGTYNYLCTPHTQMTGTVIVK